MTDDEKCGDEFEFVSLEEVGFEPDGKLHEFNKYILVVCSGYKGHDSEWHSNKVFGTRNGHLHAGVVLWKEDWDFPTTEEG